MQKPPSQKLLNALTLRGEKGSLIVWRSVNSYPTDKCLLAPVSSPQGPMLKAPALIPRPDSQADALPHAAVGAQMARLFLLRQEILLHRQHSSDTRPGAPGTRWLLMPGGGEPRAPPQCPRHQWQLEVEASRAGPWACAAQQCTPGHIDLLQAHGHRRGSRCRESHHCETKNNWAVSRRDGLAASLVLPLSSTVKAMNYKPQLDRHSQSGAGGPNGCPQAPHSQDAGTMEPPFPCGP